MARTSSCPPVAAASCRRRVVSCAVEIAGAGRSRGLAEWVEETWSTSLIVIDGGTVVHEWYADGLGPSTLFLGASMTKSVLAHLVGRAVRAGSLALTDAGDRARPRAARHRLRRHQRCWTSLTMTTGVDWVEDHRDPDSLASRLLACFAARHRLARPAPGGAARGALRPPGSATARPTRRCSTGSASGPPVAPTPTTSRVLWGELGCTTDAYVAVDGVGVALAGGGLAATARDWARVALLAVDGGRTPRRGLGRGGRAAGVPLPGSRPAAEHHHDPRRVRAPLVADGRGRGPADR